MSFSNICVDISLQCHLLSVIINTQCILLPCQPISNFSTWLLKGYISTHDSRYFWLLLPVIFPNFLSSQAAYSVISVTHIQQLHWLSRLKFKLVSMIPFLYTVIVLTSMVMGQTTLNQNPAAPVATSTTSSFSPTSNIVPVTSTSPIPTPSSIIHTFVTSVIVSETLTTTATMTTGTLVTANPPTATYETQRLLDIPLVSKPDLTLLNVSNLSNSVLWRMYECWL